MNKNLVGFLLSLLVLLSAGSLSASAHQNQEDTFSLSGFHPAEKSSVSLMWLYSQPIFICSSFDNEKQTLSLSEPFFESEEKDDDESGSFKKHLCDRAFTTPIFLGNSCVNVDSKVSPSKYFSKSSLDRLIVFGVFRI